jgi:hypothetical protein
MDDASPITAVHKIILMITAIGLIIADLHGWLPIPLD